MMKISTEKKQIEEIPITIDLMTVIGYYLAEGYPSQKGRHIAFTFGKNLLSMQGPSRSRTVSKIWV